MPGGGTGIDPVDQATIKSVLADRIPSQRGFWSAGASASALQVGGVVAPVGAASAPAGSSQLDTVFGIAFEQLNGAIIGDQSFIQIGSPTETLAERGYNFITRIKFSLPRITQCRVWEAWCQSDSSSFLNLDAPGRPHIGLRFSPPLDATLQFACSDGAVQTLIDTGHAPVADTPLWLRIEAIDATPAFLVILFDEAYNLIFEHLFSGVPMPLSTASLVLTMGTEEKTNAAATQSGITHYYGEHIHQL